MAAEEEVALTEQDQPHNSGYGETSIFSDQDWQSDGEIFIFLATDSDQDQPGSDYWETKMHNTIDTTPSHRHAQKLSVHWPRRSVNWTLKSWQLTPLEWHWNLKYGTLNVNTRYNMVPMGAALHAMFDRLLHPGPRNRGSKKYTDALEKEVFKYTLVPIDDTMEHITLFVQHNARESHAVTSDFTIHATPFDNLPKFTSHVRPHFMILHGAKAVLTFAGPALRSALEDQRVSDMVDLYRAWTQKIPKSESAMKDPDFNPPSTKDEEQEGDETKRPRRVLEKRNFQASPTLDVKGKKSGGQGNQERSGQRLEKEMVQRLVDGGKRWTGDTEEAVLGMKDRRGTFWPYVLSSRNPAPHPFSPSFYSATSATSHPLDQRSTQPRLFNAPFSHPTQISLVPGRPVRERDGQSLDRMNPP
ncbi:uncharacterized protein EI90DRAFT_3141089 [Cantharellus anzutake]|uniref:uncharacterized protein n=1 Tax=Cantharellus anzutake TaxID=1750568 RepID=UPI0019042CCB|nr:uncharacterized protein EI90DRAFT_3141089 [Cantharellus anzutake]KAF8309067.1 hypothetical protein EI90DRAFT_3141089 [Cantharellus anzutake]